MSEGVCWTTIRMQAATFEMTAFAKDGINVRKLLRTKPPLTKPAEPIYKIEITGEMEAQKTNRDVIKPREASLLGKPREKNQRKRVLRNLFPLRVRSCLFLCLGAEAQRQAQQKRPNLYLHSVSLKNPYNDFRRYFCDHKDSNDTTLIYRKEKKT